MSAQEVPSVTQQNSDGSWSKATSLGWQGPSNQVDWEVTRRDGRWFATGYIRAELAGRVTARTKWGLVRAARRLCGDLPVTFLWDQR